MDIYPISPSDPQQMQAYDLIANTNTSFFLTGQGGTGKTNLLRYAQQNVDKNILTIAFTGVAALLAGGVTAHSFFGFKTDVLEEGYIGRLRQENLAILENVDTVIIDEVSMMRCDTIDAIDRTMRCFLRSNLPFAGKQMVFVGDMFQLEPIVSSGGEHECLKDMYGCEHMYFFKAKVFQRMRIPRIELTRIYRQNDARFLQLLNGIRYNTCSEEDMTLLNSCVRTVPKDDGPIITLTATRKKADAINMKRLAEIDGTEYTYNGEVTGNFEKKKMPVDEVIRLKVGAQVMFLRNDSCCPRRYVNGSLATITSLSENCIEARLEDGSTVTIGKVVWEAKEPEYNRESKKMTYKVVGSYAQYPIKLAWAITIHKVQGNTFNKVIVDPGSYMFACGQMYVAISRVRSLDGLYLTCPITKRHISTSAEVIEYAKCFNDEELIERELACGKALFEAERSKDEDAIAAALFDLVLRYTVQGDYKEAVVIAGRFFDNVICDEPLLGRVDSLPDDLLTQKGLAATFLKSMLCLYGNRYAEALTYIDEVLCQHKCAHALFIKSRCLTLLERFQEADNVHEQLCEYFDADSPDAKMLYNIALVNELYTHDPGVGLMQALLKAHPRYRPAVKAMHIFLHRRGIELTSEEECQKFVKLFNSELDEEKFMKSLENIDLPFPQITALLSKIKCE